MIVDYLQAVVSRFNANTGRDGVSGRPLPVPLFIGEEHINQNDSPPRIVVVPTHDVFGPPSRIGKERRALKSCDNVMEVGIWGPDVPSLNRLVDYEAVRQMRDDLVVALHQEARGRFGETGSEPQGYAIRGARWMTAGNVISYGFVSIIEILLKTPVLVSDQVFVQVPINTETLNGKIESE